VPHSQYNRKSPKYDIIIWDGTNEVEVRDFVIDASTWYQMMASDPILSTVNDDGSLTVADSWGYVNARIPLNGYASCGPYWLDPLAEGARGSNTLEFGPTDTLAAKYTLLPGTETSDPLPPGGSVDYHDGGAGAGDPSTTDPGTAPGTEPAGSADSPPSDASTGATAPTGTDTPPTDTSAPTDATAPDSGTPGTDATPSTDAGSTAPA
jgi:hypothetical protein